MKPQDIISIINSKNATLSGISRDLKVSRSAVSLAVHGKTYSPLIQMYISKHIGIDTTVLWPELYGKGAKPRKNGRPMSNGFSDPCFS